MRFTPPQYWQDVNSLVTSGRFLELFADYWGNSTQQFAFIERADVLAEEAHRQDIRKCTGEPYIYHPRRAALMLAFRLGIYGPGITAGALFHDVHEDHADDYTLQSIETELNTYTRIIVEALTKFPQLGLEAYPAVRNKLMAAKVKAAGHVSVLVKGYERNDNVLTLCGSPAAQGEQIDETVRFILPLTRSEPQLYRDLAESIALRKAYIA